MNNRNEGPLGGIDRLDFMKRQLLPYFQRLALDSEGRIRPGVLEGLADLFELFDTPRDKSTIYRMLRGQGEIFGANFGDPNKATILTLFFGLDTDKQFTALCRQAGVSLPSAERFTSWHRLVDRAKKILSESNWDFRFREMFLREIQRVTFQAILRYPQVSPIETESTQIATDVISDLLPEFRAE